MTPKSARDEAARQERIKNDPVYAAKRLEMQRAANARRDAKVAADPVLQERRRAYQREAMRRRLAKIKADPIALAEQRQKYKEYDAKRAADPVAHEARRRRDREDYATNPERRSRNAMSHKEWKRLNPEKVKTRAQEYYARKRGAVFAHYDQACVCCGETEAMFLTVDHPNNDGAQHKKIVGTQGIYRWLVKKGFPEGFRIQCYNCNAGRWRNGGECPHEIARRQQVASAPSYVSEGSLLCSTS